MIKYTDYDIIGVLFMKIQTLILGAMGTNCYILRDDASTECAVIDPADSCDEITARIERLGVVLKYIILTHAHFDHMLALEELRTRTGAPLAIHVEDNPALGNPVQTYMKQFGGRNDTARPAEILLRDGDRLTLGGEEIEIIHTPGHTRGSICMRCRPEILITGDTLFKGDIGRYDLYGGDYRTLSDSLSKLASLEGDYRVYPGHGGTTRLSTERANNVEMQML